MESWLVHIGAGMLDAMSPIIFLTAFLGVIIGVVIGVIPGLGPAVAISLAIPITYSMGALPAIGLMLGIYKGGTYGGSISAVLINTPGTPAAAATILEGWPLACQGKAGKALHLALIASVMGDAIGILILCAVAQPISQIALKFGPAEIFSLLLFALTIVGGLAGRSPLKGLLSASLGLMLCCIGTDPMSGETRYTFDFVYLDDGIAIIPMIIGLFAVAEVLQQSVRHRHSDNAVSLLPPPASPADNRISFEELRPLIPTIIQSSIIGAGIGALPGTGSTTAAYMCYGTAQRRSKTPEQFGKGSLEGLAAAESGNNAVCGGALVPMLTLGIPGDVVTAILMGALMVHGIHVGPTVFTEHQQFVFTLFSILLISVGLLYIVGEVAIKICRSVADMPQSIIMPIVMCMCVLGAFATNNSLSDVWLMLGMGLVGMVFNKLDVPLAPMIIAFVLTPKMELSMRQALILSRGEVTVFFTHPISAFFLCLATFSIWQVYKMNKKTKKIP